MLKNCQQWHFFAHSFKSLHKVSLKLSKNLYVPPGGLCMHDLLFRGFVVCTSKWASRDGPFARGLFFVLTLLKVFLYAVVIFSAKCHCCIWYTRLSSLTQRIFLMVPDPIGVSYFQLRIFLYVGVQNKFLSFLCLQQNFSLVLPFLVCEHP